jgi:DNA-binding transcriptional regulator YiaG
VCETLPYSYQSWIVICILQRFLQKCNSFVSLFCPFYPALSRCTVYRFRYFMTKKPINGSILRGSKLPAALSSSYKAETEVFAMQEYKDAVREHLSSYVCQLRQRRGLTQEEMAEKLRITARAYGDLERGKFCFSAPALMALLLILKEDEVAELLNDFRKITEKLDGKEVA